MVSRVAGEGGQRPHPGVVWMVGKLGWWVREAHANDAANHQHSATLVKKNLHLRANF